MSLLKEFENAKDVKDIFELVKEAVKLTLNESRAGIDLGLVEMGNGQNQLLSAYYPVGSNIIVLNKTPLKRVIETRPDLMKPYVFVVLLHEYIHSLGYIDEETVRVLTHRIVESIFNESIMSEMAKDMTKFFPVLIYPGGHPAGNEMHVIEMEEPDYIG